MSDLVIDILDDPEERKRIKNRMRAAKLKSDNPNFNRVDVDAADRDAMQCERAKEWTTPPTITQWLMGDPAPGRSALDAKRKAQNE